ncbi:GNAT family N-acetyltransferase [Luteolibacter ambystomatis]|uniref:GNAT family N-acetyltransferase n=1 Tax=Luteolibacter ambystomatis TaxID=2824561 RepID=A0A975J250_9BACT|nr:GNAT family N-acetyltransferase [Luteolibacter ambystomatis]QUE52596.1 GNAT family N-acetyltransferase [Luteolibacter ambystomatis]
MEHSTRKMITFRRINLGEGLLYKEVRLASLRDSPEAFSSTLVDAMLRSDDSWHAQADQSARGSDRATFLATDERPVGLAALYRDERFEHTTELIQMWVSPEQRSRGLSRKLLSFAVNWAQANGYRTIRAEVMPDNLRALRFYERYGFVRSGEVSKHTEAGVILMLDVEQAGALFYESS